MKVIRVVVTRDVIGTPHPYLGRQVSTEVTRGEEECVVSYHLRVSELAGGTRWQWAL
jgi:hypothetical protein